MLIFLSLFSMFYLCRWISYLHWCKLVCMYQGSNLAEIVNILYSLVVHFNLYKKYEL